MPRLAVTGRDGSLAAIEAPVGERLMFVLRDGAGLPVEGACGGCASCGTCHVYVEAGWFDRLPSIGEAERDMLAQLAFRDPARSRLSCQIVATAALDGLSLTLAPEE